MNPEINSIMDSSKVLEMSTLSASLIMVLYNAMFMLSIKAKKLALPILLILIIITLKESASTTPLMKLMLHVITIESERYVDC